MKPYHLILDYVENKKGVWQSQRASITVDARSHEEAYNQAIEILKLNYGGVGDATVTPQEGTI